MDVPRLDDLKIGNLLGTGGSGRVFAADTRAGEARVVRVLNDATVDRGLVEKVMGRLEAGGWPDGVLPVLAADFASREAIFVSPRCVHLRADGSQVADNLQMRLDAHPGEGSWELVNALAKALAGMHARGVAHGNLKPGNLFFSKEGGVFLSDWATGNMPGLRQFAFTDAVLYQAPEQLRDPGGYLSGAGARWDVFAFGVLAFRVLTGDFPRCHGTFSLVAPPAGVARKEGIQADLGKIAKNLEAQPEFAWPDAAQNELEQGFRAWIDRCLALDPALRPASMVEVSEAFVSLQAEANAQAGRAAAGGVVPERKSEWVQMTTFFIAGVAGTAAVMFGYFWWQVDGQLQSERQAREVEVALRKQDVAAAGAAVNEATAAVVAAENKVAAAEKEAAEARQAVNYERDLAVARLEESRLIGDRLFAWAMEKGHRRLPPLDGRALRLNSLERYFQEFLKRTEKIESLVDERARVRLQLAEIALAAGDASLASLRIREALAAWNGLPVDAELKLRMATNALLLALLQQSVADPALAAGFAAARRALDEVPRAGVDVERLQQLVAILDFHEAKFLAARGEDQKALEQLMRATQSLNQLADQRPDAAILRSELAACYLSSATILEGMGSMGDAREVRAQAVDELRKLLEISPDDYAMRLELAGCYAAMAEAAVLAGDVAKADSLCADSMALLDRLLAEQPDNIEAVSRKASQLGLRSGLLRDRGLSAEALKDSNDGIRMLENVRASAPEHAMASYRMALLLWQKGRILGMDGERDEEISLMGKARDLLAQLEVSASSSGPRPEQLQSSGAYLLGDLGHALQLAGRVEEATEIFTDSVVQWENLLKSRPQSEEYSEGLAWCRQRLADLREN